METTTKPDYTTYVFKSGKHQGMSLLEAYKKNRSFVIWLALECTYIPLMNMARQLLIDFEQAECELVEDPDKPTNPAALFALGEMVSLAHDGSQIVITECEYASGGWGYEVEPKSKRRFWVAETDIIDTTQDCPF
jgi:hypothetical protein